MTEQEQPKTDFFLKLNSESDLPVVLKAFYHQEYSTTTDSETGEEIKTPQGEPYLVLNTPDYAIDVVGTIHKPTGNTITSPEGFEYPETAAIAGYHVNIRLNNNNRRADLEALSDYFVDPTPSTPSRVWL